MKKLLLLGLALGVVLTVTVSFSETKTAQDLPPLPLVAKNTII